MSCFKIDNESVEPLPFGDLNSSLRVLATVEVDPNRAVFAAAMSLAATHAGADYALLRSNSTIDDPIQTTRDVLDAVHQPILVELGCPSSIQARRFIEAGAQAVVLGNEALLRPSLIRDVALEIGSDRTVVAIDCHAAGPGCIEVLDSEGRPSGFDCASWLEQIETLGASSVLLRPGPNVPSEGLLALLKSRSCLVYVDRTGWDAELVTALGADGVVVQGALGTRQHLDQVTVQRHCDLAG